jgi:CRP-like cAMP-binding protein
MVRCAMQFLIQYLENFIEINQDDLQLINNLFHKRVYAKGEDIFSAGEICQTLYYISQGAVRTYSITSEGKDLTWGVSYNKNGKQLNHFAGDYVSYLTQTPSNFFIETLDDCIIYKAKLSEIDTLYASDIKWMSLGKKISDGYLIRIGQNTQMLRQLTAKEKYILMKEIEPLYEEILPDYQYATLLGITPQSLSRIKSQI